MQDEHNSNPIANYLFMKYVRGQNMSAAPEIKSFTAKHLVAELLISATLAGLMCSNQGMNYYQFERLILENI